MDALPDESRLWEFGRRFIRDERRRYRLARTFLPFLVLILLWQVSAQLSGFSSYFYPRPADVAKSFVEIVRNGILPVYMADSLARWGVGVGSGLVLALVSGILFAFIPILNRAFLPTVNFFHAIAEIAWLPLFILWFGFSFLTIVISLAYVVFFPVLYNVMLGFRAVPSSTIDVVKTLGGGRRHLVFYVLVPGAFPQLVTGFRVGAGYAFRALVAAEVIAATTGLGFMIFEARATQQTSRTVVGMIVIGVIWLGIDRFYLRPLERATTERWGMVARDGGDDA